MILNRAGYEAAGQLIDAVLEGTEVPEGLFETLMHLRPVLANHARTGAELDRVFAKQRDAMVLHNLLLRHEEHSLQLDHLILLRRGFLLVDSSSVTGDVQVERGGTWYRVEEGERVGFVSPLVKMQSFCDWLREYLEVHAQHVLVRRPTYASFGYFGSYMPRYFVTMPTGTSLLGWKFRSLTEVMVDVSAVGERALDAYRAFRPPPWKSLLGRLPPEKCNNMTRKELLAVGRHLREQGRCREPFLQVVRLLMPVRDRLSERARFLIHRQTEATTSIVTRQLSQDGLEAVRHYCRFCQGEELDLDAGAEPRPLFVCRDCGKATPVDTTCELCGFDFVLYREKQTFFRRCTQCGNERIFFIARPPVEDDEERQA